MTLGGLIQGPHSSGQNRSASFGQACNKRLRVAPPMPDSYRHVGLAANIY
jgi:hypothetical protein